MPAVVDHEKRRQQIAGIAADLERIATGDDTGEAR